MAVHLPPYNRSSVKHLSLENVYLILSLYENKCKVIPLWVVVQLPPKITGRNVKHLSLENINQLLLSTKINERLYQKGWQISCHQITGRNVKHLSLENVYLILSSYENKCKVVP